MYIQEVPSRSDISASPIRKREPRFHCERSEEKAKRKGQSRVVEEKEREGELDARVPGVGSSSISGRYGSGEGLTGSDVVGGSSALVDEGIALKVETRKGKCQISKSRPFSLVSKGTSDSR